MARKMKTTRSSEGTLNEKFSEIYDMDTTEVQEKKGDYTYVSWPYAVKILREFYPEATWKVSTNKAEDGVPLFWFGKSIGFMVHCVLMLEDQVFEEWFPVTDNRNEAILQDGITVTDVNTAIKRCLVKLIAQVTGYGLKIYGGEDLPGASEERVALMYELVEHPAIGEKNKAKVLEFYKTWQEKNFFPKESVDGTIEKLQSRIRQFEDRKESEQPEA